MLSLLLVVACATFADNGATDGKSATSPVAVVEIKGLKFVPAELTITAGTSVKWVNRDPFDHDVTSGVSINGREMRGMKQTRFPDHKFSSGLFGENKSFSFIFDEPGEYKYYCNIHPFMVASIVVK